MALSANQIKEFANSNPVLFATERLGVGDYGAISTGIPLCSGVPITSNMSF